MINTSDFKKGMYIINATQVDSLPYKVIDVDIDNDMLTLEDCTKKIITRPAFNTPNKPYKWYELTMDMYKNKVIKKAVDSAIYKYRWLDNLRDNKQSEETIDERR